MVTSSSLISARSCVINLRLEAVDRRRLGLELTLHSSGQWSSLSWSVAHAAKHRLPSSWSEAQSLIVTVLLLEFVREVSGVWWG